MNFKEGDVVVSDGFLCEFIKETKDRIIVNNMSGYKVGISKSILLRKATDKDFINYINKYLHITLFTGQSMYGNIINVLAGKDDIVIDTDVESISLELNNAYKIAIALSKYFNLGEDK